MSVLTNITDVETYLSLDPANPLTSGNADEALLTSLITAASAFIEGTCGRTFAQAAFTEIRDGKRTREMFVRNPPIVSVSGVTIGVDAIPAGSVNPPVPGYMFDDKRIVLQGYFFCAGLMNVALSYTGGYATIPSDLAQACIELVALRYKERSHFDMSSKSNAGETTAFVTADLKPSSRVVLERYTRRTGL